MSNLLKLGVIAVFASLCAACASSNQLAKDQSSTPANLDGGSAGNEVEVTQANLSLADYLRRIPGVKVQGSGNSAKVLVRSASTVSLTTEPLFVIDNVPIGNSYSQIVNMISVNDIQNVRVLKSGGEAAAYGTRGSNGVVLIRTKKNK